MTARTVRGPPLGKAPEVPEGNRFDMFIGEGGRKWVEGLANGVCDERVWKVVDITPAHTLQTRWSEPLG
jgi:hypothetical protein